MNESEKLLDETLDFWKYKLRNGLCTMEEIERLSKLAQTEIDTIGTAQDFAKFCDKPEVEVRKVINRKVLDKPKRRVYYKFQSFIKNVPSKWLKDK